MKMYCGDCGTIYNDETVVSCPTCGRPTKELARKRIKGK